MSDKRTPQERAPISEQELQQIKSNLISWNNADRLVLSLEQAHAELRELRKENARLKHVAATYARIFQGKLTPEDIGWADSIIAARAAVKGESA